MSNNSNFTVRNSTTQRLVLRDHRANQGIWQGTPPAAINVGAVTPTMSITSNNNGPTSGYVIYEADSGPQPRHSVEFSVVCSPTEAAGRVRTFNSATWRHTVIYGTHNPLNVAFTLTN
ncbi:hypothetical protein CVT25_009506 [Psilocybe cyanescens]|uniref:Uncharacterized protein n=1 Tax=Psilocybe cyanescens TaxID=93625 RepID=A0A409XAW3_PSICY|nr:hypothetical protein CVT25_009506 [Psilocybe cyanescens]